MVRTEIVSILIKNIAIILLIAASVYYLQTGWALLGLIFLTGWTPDKCPHCGKLIQDTTEEPSGRVD